LIVEAVAQTALVVLRSVKMPSNNDSRVLGEGLLAKIDVARFLVPIVPLDTVSFDVIIKRKIGSFCLVSGSVVRRSDQTLCATCELTLSLADV
jgi:3-hydroxymyristoyl/3-hydroxydecanoyl-(acyl carrier protein) dehydratase